MKMSFANFRNNYATMYLIVIIIFIFLISYIKDELNKTNKKKTAIKRKERNSFTNRRKKAFNVKPQQLKEHTCGEILKCF